MTSTVPFVDWPAGREASCSQVPEALFAEGIGRRRLFPVVAKPVPCWTTSKRRTPARGRRGGHDAGFASEDRAQCPVRGRVDSPAESVHLGGPCNPAATYRALRKAERGADPLDVGSRSKHEPGTLHLEGGLLRPNRMRWMDAPVKPIPTRWRRTTAGSRSWRAWLQAVRLTSRDLPWM